MSIDVILFLGFTVIVGLIVLQIYAIKKKYKWAGLIIPLITFIVSIAAVMSINYYSAIYLLDDVPIKNAESDMASEQIVDVIPENRVRQLLIANTLVMACGYIFLLINVPTVIFLTIYVVKRNKRKRQCSLDKMIVQDLE